MQILSTENTTNLTQELIPVSKWNEYYDFPTVGALRQLIFYKDKNGFNRVIRIVGKRIYIKVSEFFKWVEDTNRASA